MNTKRKMTKSGIALIAILALALIAGVTAQFTSEDIDEVCSSDNNTLFRTNGSWRCGSLQNVIWTNIVNQTNIYNNYTNNANNSDYLDGRDSSEFAYKNQEGYVVDKDGSYLITDFAYSSEFATDSDHSFNSDALQGYQWDNAPYPTELYSKWTQYGNNLSYSIQNSGLNITQDVIYFGEFQGNGNNKTKSIRMRSSNTTGTTFAYLDSGRDGNGNFLNMGHNGGDNSFIWLHRRT